MNKSKIHKLPTFLMIGFLFSLILVLHTSFASVPLVIGANSVKEPFKDFFDYEWWFPGSEYAGKGSQYGKWMVVEMFWDDGVPRQWFEITNTNPITGTDSARMFIDGSKSDVGCMAWQGLSDSPDPESLPYSNRWLNPAYLRFRFRLDEWQTSDSKWRITLAALGGSDYSGLEGQVILGLEGIAPPHLVMRYRYGSTFDTWNVDDTEEIISATTVSLGDVHTLEIMRYSDTVNGEIKVWLNGVEIDDLNVNNIDTSYPGGAGSVLLGSSSSEENGFFSKGQSLGSSCIITFDDLIVRDQYIGTSPLSIANYDLVLDSSPQGKTVRVGNHILDTTPITIKIPEGTIPKVGIDPTDFDHWEISPDFDDFSSYSENWSNITTSLIATVSRIKDLPGQNVGSRPTPAIYTDTRITAMYAGGTKYSLSVISEPSVVFTIDGIDYDTNWIGNLTKGKHTIITPLTFIEGDYIFNFKYWENNSIDTERIINLLGDMQITAYYEITEIPEFPTSLSWLLIIGTATLLILIGNRKFSVSNKK